MILIVKPEHHHHVSSWLNSATRYGGWNARSGTQASIFTVTSEYLQNLVGEALRPYITKQESREDYE